MMRTAGFSLPDELEEAWSAIASAHDAVPGIEAGDLGRSQWATKWTTEVMGVLVHSRPFLLGRCEP